MEDFRRMLSDLGCWDYRIMSQRKIKVDDSEIARKAGAVEFYSMTIRAFKLDDLEDRCEDFGQVAYYLGTMAGCPNKFILDDQHTFIVDKPMFVCGNTASMISNTRFGKHFKIVGNKNKHFGLFPCAPGANNDNPTGSCC